MDAWKIEESACIEHNDMRAGKFQNLVSCLVGTAGKSSMSCDMVGGEAGPAAGKSWL